MKGNRKMIVFFGAGAMLLAGLGICMIKPEVAIGLYGIFAPAVATATGIFTWGNTKEYKP